jgi:hypothetical protein
MGTYRKQSAMPDPYDIVATCGACGHLTHPGEPVHVCDLDPREDYSAGVVAIHDAIIMEVLAQLGELSDTTIDLCHDLAADEDDPAIAEESWIATAEDLAACLVAAVTQRAADWMADNG